MPAPERKIRAVVIELHHLPILRTMTAATVITVAACMDIIGAVAGDAALIVKLILLGDMAADTGNIGVAPV